MSDLREVASLAMLAVFTAGLSAAAQSQNLDGFYAPLQQFQSAEAIVAIVGTEADAAFMVGESLKRYATKRSEHRIPANRILEPATAAQFREEWVHLSGVRLVRLSQQEALTAWNARQRLLGILRIERHEKSLTFYIGTRQCDSGGAVGYRFTPTRGAWLVSEQVGPAFATHTC